MLLNNRGFVDAVASLGTFDWLRGAGINAEFKSQHGPGGTLGVEGIPMGFNNVE